MSVELKSSFQELCRRLKRNVRPGSGISNRFLQSFCRTACSRDFAGVFASDRLPTDICNKPNFIIVVNLGKRDSLTQDGRIPVGHFITIVASPKQVTYIDPFGLPPSGSPAVGAFLSSCKRRIKINRKQVQDMESNYCGLFCILFVCYADGRGREMELRFYRTNMKRNDKLCDQYLNRMFSPSYTTAFKHQKRFSFL